MAKYKSELSFSPHLSSPQSSKQKLSSTMFELASDGIPQLQMLSGIEPDPEDEDKYIVK